jgi:hypothetical protein
MPLIADQPNLLVVQTMSKRAPWSVCASAMRSAAWG